MFCGWESDFSLVHTQLISTLCPLFQLRLPYSLCAPLLHTLGTPLPFITPQVKSHLDLSSALFSGSCCLGLGLRGGIQSYKALPTMPSQYHHLWEVFFHCLSSWHGRRWQDPRLTGHKNHKIGVLLEPFGSSFPYFPPGGSCSFPGLGRGMDGENWGRVRNKRRMVRKQYRKKGNNNLKCNFNFRSIPFPLSSL